MRKMKTCGLIAALVMVSALSVHAKREKAPEEGAMSMTIVSLAVVHLRPDDLTTIVAGRADTAGGVRGQNTIAGFNSPDVTVTFCVRVPKDDDYTGGVIFSSPESHTMELRCGESV